MGDSFIQGTTKLDFGKLVDLLEQRMLKILSDDANKKNAIHQQHRFLSRKETASLLHVSLVTLAKLTSSGKLKSYRVSKKILYKESEILEALTLVNPLKLKK